MLKRRPRLAATRNLRSRTSTLWALEEGKVNDSKQVQRRQFNRWLVSASLIPMAGKVLALEALRPKARVAVVGAGIVGSAITYHLAKRGLDVTLLDRNAVASASSHGTFAWINASWAKQPESYHALNQMGVDAWHRLQQALNLPIKWGGSLEWFAAAERQDRLSRDVQEQQAWGEPAKMLTQLEASALEPRVAFGGAGHVALSPRDGALDPVLVSQRLVNAAKSHGARVIEHCEVLRVDETAEDQRQKILGTSCGDIAVDRLVLATGADPSAIQTFAGFDLPQRSTPGVIVITQPMPPVLSHIVVAPGIHIHQRLDGRLVLGEQEGAPENAAHKLRLTARPTRFPNAATASQHAQRLITLAREYVTGLPEVSAEEVIIGWRPLPLDGHPVIGPSPADPNAYVAVMHSGVSLAAIVGELVAEEILTGERAPVLTPFRADRAFESVRRY
ncbi:FAD-binding oxidoreductase [Luminiphilus sp.]|nr:FAD-binding oxidoreductase [Luminiphilus sp.]